MKCCGSSPLAAGPSPEFVDNDVSATSRKPRPQFDRMMACVDAGDFDVIVARHMDRLLRRLAEFESVLERCTATKTAIVTAADGVVSGAGPGGRPLGCAGVMVGRVRGSWG